MTTLIATRQMRYATRHLEAGDTFDTHSERDAITLTAIKKARRLTPEEQAKIDKKEAREQKKEATKESAAAVLAQVNEVPFLRFRNLAIEVLGDQTPSTKAEIIAALENKAGTAAG